MPRPKLKDNRERYLYMLKQIASNSMKDSASTLKIRLIALIEWAAYHDIRVITIKKEELTESEGIAPTVSEAPAKEEVKPVRNFLEEIEGLK